MDILLHSFLLVSHLTLFVLIYVLSAMFAFNEVPAEPLNARAQTLPILWNKV